MSAAWREMRSPIASRLRLGGSLAGGCATPACRGASSRVALQG